MYSDELLDPVRLSWKVLEDLEADLGQYGYAGQIGQDPTPPGGGMFKVAHFQFVNDVDPNNPRIHTVRYWDKANTTDSRSAYTVGVKMSILADGRWIVEDVKRGKWGTHEREAIIFETARNDGQRVIIWIS